MLFLLQVHSLTTVHYKQKSHLSQYRKVKCHASVEGIRIVAKQTTISFCTHVICFWVISILLLYSPDCARVNALLVRFVWRLITGHQLNFTAFETQHFGLKIAICVDKLHCVRKKVTPAIHFRNSNNQHRILTQFYTNDAKSSCQQTVNLQ